MVKLFAPAMSLDATGTVADAMTFSKWKGRNYLRKRSAPSNPKTGLQVGIRSMFGFLTANWDAITTTRKATWSTLAQARNISNFNAYVASNVQRWKRFQAPSHRDPAWEDGEVGTYAVGQPAATGGVSSITIAHNLDDDNNDNWGLMIFKGSTGFSTALANCVAVILSDQDATDYSWIDTALAPATYFYNTRLFTNVGDLGAELGEISAAAT